ncbi:MAG: hypothetical protein K2W88_21265 [Pararheinheimera sp.]|nr:hypothetical protein [Rheinheimera sp.]
MDSNSISSQESTLRELAAKRARLVNELSTLDVLMQEAISQAAQRSYQPLSENTLSDVIDANLGTLQVSELTAICGISPGTYYNIRTKPDTVSVGKLSALLKAIGLQLYVGKQ